MAQKVVFKFKFSGNAGVQRPLVYIWVDCNDDAVGSRNERVTLVQDGLEWTGEAQIPGKTAAGTWFLVAYRGPKGAGWSLTVKPAGDEDTILCKETGRVERPRHAFWSELSSGEPA